MKFLSPVVWSEGMYLGPHQFQAQNRYVEESLAFATASLWSEDYGFLACEVSPDALGNGQVLLVQARGLFPDGLAFDSPDSDEPPPVRDIGDAFSPASTRLLIYLAVPASVPDRQNYALHGEAAERIRFSSEGRSVHDETTGRDERNIRFGRKNIRIVFEDEEAPGCVKLPLARLARSQSRGYRLDENYVPPCLEISASPRLMQMLGRLVGLLEDRSTALARSAGEQPSFSVQELTRFWLLHTINASLVPLRHLYLTRRGHPELLFLELSRLAGALCTFTLESHPRTLPRYDHEALGDCMEALDTHIRRHLDIVIPTNCIRIALGETEQYFFAGDVTDGRCYGRASWILAVSGGGGELDILERVPRLVKVCSEAFVPELVRRALPGFALQHLPAPPAAIAPRPGTQYFLLNTAGPCWDHIRKTSRVGVYVPGELPHPSIELLVVIESPA